MLKELVVTLKILIVWFALKILEKKIIYGLALAVAYPCTWTVSKNGLIISTKRKKKIK